MKPRDILLFQNADQSVNVSVYFQNGTFWLTQKSMAELFGVNVPAVNKHLKNIFDTGELEKDATISILEIVRQEGNRSVKRTMEFFGMVQNKLHWAITGKTAAEIIYTEADASKLYMGLKTWKDAPNGKIQKSDVSIAKNYLAHQHIQELNRIVSAYLDLAENNAQRGRAFSMHQWANFLDSFLELSSYPILRDTGKISMLEAKLKAEGEFDKFRVIQDQNYQSDFDKLIAKTKK